MKLLSPALFLFTISFMVSLRFVAAQDPAPISPPSQIGATTPDPNCCAFIVDPSELKREKDLEDAGDLVQAAIMHLPAWEKDGLAVYEQPELAAVKADIESCKAADPKNPDDFLKSVQKLKDDSGALVALDDFLSKADVI
jgi:hypothetical protein